MTRRTASCSCGQLTATCAGEPEVSVCHCHACQRRTGSAFGAQAHFPREAVAINGDSESYTRVSDDGFWCKQGFCRGCGATVFYEIEHRPGKISIPLGGFAGQALPEPSRSSYDERRLAWVVIGGAGLEGTTSPER